MALCRCGTASSSTQVELPAPAVRRNGRALSVTDPDREPEPRQSVPVTAPAIQARLARWPGPGPIGTAAAALPVFRSLGESKARTATRIGLVHVTSSFEGPRKYSDSKSNLLAVHWQFPMHGESESRHGSSCSSSTQ